MKEVTAAVIIKNNKVFITRRAPGEKFAGGWEFPGGKLETGETPQECLRRELYEEFTIDTTVKDFLAESVYEYPHGAIRLLAYLVEIVSGEIKLKVHDRYEWVSSADLLNYDLLPADIPIAKRVMEIGV